MNGLESEASATDLVQRVWQDSDVSLPKGFKVTVGKGSEIHIKFSSSATGFRKATLEQAVQVLDQLVERFFDQHPNTYVNFTLTNTANYEALDLAKFPNFVEGLQAKPLVTASGGSPFGPGAGQTVNPDLGVSATRSRGPQL